MTCQCGLHAALAVSGPPRELEVALEHLRHAVHSPVAQRAPARQGRDRSSAVAVDASVGYELVRLAFLAVAEHLIGNRKRPPLDAHISDQLRQ